MSRLAGVEGAAGLVERVALHPAVPGGVLLDPAPAGIQRVASETDDMEWVHHRNRVGELFRGGGLEPAEPVHRDHLDPVAPLLRAAREPLLEDGLGAAFDHVQQARGAGLLAGGREVDDHGDVLVAESGVSPDVLVDADRGDPVEPGRVVDEAPLAFGEDRGVRGVPRHPETGGGARDGEVVDHDRSECPPDPAAGDLRPGRGRLRRVLPPGAAAGHAPVAAHPD